MIEIETPFCLVLIGKQIGGPTQTLSTTSASLCTISLMRNGYTVHRLVHQPLIFGPKSKKKMGNYVQKEGEIEFSPHFFLASIFDLAH